MLSAESISGQEPLDRVMALLGAIIDAEGGDPLDVPGMLIIIAGAMGRHLGAQDRAVLQRVLLRAAERLDSDDAGLWHGSRAH